MARNTNGEEITTLLEATLHMLEGNLGSMTPQTGKGVIDGWIELLRHRPDSTALTNLLESLKNQLSGGQPDPHALAELMKQMAGQVNETKLDSQFSGPLDQLTKALQTAADTFTQKQLD